MSKKYFIFLLWFGLGIVAFATSTTFGQSYDVRIAIAGDDREEQLPAGNISNNSDLEMPYEETGKTTEQVIGLRYQAPIAKGAQVLEAYVEFTVDETKGGTEPVNLIIDGHLTPDAGTLTSSITFNISARKPRTKTQVAWAVPNWTAAGEKSRTPDISGILNEIFNQDGWKSGNSLVLIFQDDKSRPSSGVRAADAFEDGNPPVLHIRVATPLATAPNPADGDPAVGLPLFSWTKGDRAVLHNIYFGTTPDLTAANLVEADYPVEEYYYAPGLEPGIKYYWRVDEIDAAGVISIGPVWNFMAEPIPAWGPNPANGSVDSFPAPTLSWSPGKLVLEHQLFFSNKLADVADGIPAADKGKMTETKFYPGVLRSSTTYYWRVDEYTVDGNVNKGAVWSFTTAAGVSKKIISQWWFGIAGGAISALTSDPAYPNNPTGTELRDDFRGQFTNLYDTYGMRVYGWLIPPESGDYTFWIAANDVGQLLLSTDADPANATVICSDPTGGDPDEWDSAAANKSAPITLQAGQKYYIMALQKDSTGRDHVSVAWQGPGIISRIIISSQYVDTFALPPVMAFSPNPADGQTNVPQSGALIWSAGDKAQKHDVYFGDDKAAVAAADTASPLYKGRQDGTTFDVADLEWGKTYFWRVDEIDATGAVTAGSVWSFTTANFISVDDMESYDDDLNVIYNAWTDNYDPQGDQSGSVVGNTTSPFAERTIVHAGKQAMPMNYNNAGPKFLFSEATKTFAPVQDWTVKGVTDLSLWFRGDPVRFADKGNGAFTVSGAGHDIWDDADDFRFVYKRFSGNGSIVARVESIGNTNVWAKAGVMIRESLDAGSPMAYMIQSAASGVSFGWRLIPAGTCGSATQAAIVAPQWVKLTRTGDAFTTQYSADGTTWTDIKDATTGAAVSTTINMTGSIYIGLCVTSHDAALITAAEFSEVTTTGNVTGAWQVAEIGDDPQPGNSPAPLYVAVEDNTGKIAVATHPDPAASVLATWTEWKIPLSSLTGINLTKVKALHIGVGDRNNPVQDGTGRIYIDDVRVGKP
jgi:hypothetical protein